MNLVVDIGNSRVKLAVMESGRCIAERCADRVSGALLSELAVAFPIRRAIVSSTRGDAADAAAVVRAQGIPCLEFTPQTPVPIASDYFTPLTLGSDRLAAAVGVSVLWPGRNVLIVDCGTAVTIDFVTADGTFRGGSISPGLHMRFRALHEFTAALPLGGVPDSEELFGRSTADAIGAGVLNSLVFEIEGYVRRLQQQIDGLCVIFTGGDAKYLTMRIKNAIFADRNPVFCGLDRILEFNASEEDLP